MLSGKVEYMARRDAGNEYAVSPVIGVMLMITVTIIIAATLSAFVGGSTGDLKKSPQATLVVKSDGTCSDGTLDIVFEHRGGDLLRTADLEIVTWVQAPNGTMIKNVQDPDRNGANVAGDVSGCRLPVVYDSQSGGSCPAQGFGSATWKTGTTAGTEDSASTAAFLNVTPDDLTGICENHTPVEVDIVHQPSGIVILKTTILPGEGS